ncbi:DNA methyltransferase [Helicobacter pylori]|uniref:site-specific DNA-methyltransferase (adenine-specific) n=4 Tax=Helicobacter pylori TaxID=210 RepID=V6CI89_HELPY|nr:type ISP restriction/modification enzyme [Helicobacter pylori]AUV78474.1 DNA methyltransferase [Helicobacter pylori]AUV79983.1 DNA methyltransferase [Helicobacter pylori]CDK13005.1 Type IIG R-M system [Helicobacter pylori 26695]
MLKEYLESIKDLTPEKNELTHRPSLYNLLNQLKNHFNKEFKIEHEPERKQGSQPDFRVSYQGINIGYIENKRAGTNLSQLLKSEKSDQILKYLELNPNLMLTDYLNFMWVGKDENNEPLIKKEISVASLDELSKPLKPNPQTERDLIELFKSFFNHEAAPITNAKDFATHLSPRTKYLKDALIKYQEKAQVSSIFNNFKEYLYEELSFEDFSDALAQTLTYSLFLAKLNHPSEKINLDNVRSLIPKNFAVIREMADFLKKLDEIKEIQWLLNEILSSINHVDMDSILKDLNDDKDPYLHFYETFLSTYDPKLRESKGVYYTPDSVVKFIINALDSLLKTHFKDAPLGLKSALDNENIKLLDFATGTGTFLLEAFRKALETRKTSDGGTSTKEDKYQNLLKQFYGFEYLIAPYAIAHLNLSQAFKEEFKKPLKENDALQIILTNTLIQPSEIIAYRGLSPIFEKELSNAQEIKKNENILIITGNPPYSGASENKGLFEWEVKATYGIDPKFQTIEIEKNVKLADKIQTLLSSVQIQKQSGSKNDLKKLKSLHSKYKLQDEKNPKWLLDDYVKFMRFAQNKIESLGHGLFGFISNNAFLDNPTFRGLRRSLLECYDELYILNLHGNARKKEKTPQGAKDENVFNIKQGVSINLFVKNPQVVKQKIHYYDVYGQRTEKYAFLAQNDLNSIEWLEIAPRGPFYLLLPLETPLLDEYEQGFSVQEMFQIGSTGICSQRDHVVFHKDKESLLKLLKDFSTLEPSELRRIYNIKKDGRDWRLEYAIKDVKANANNLEEYIVSCQYRPFDFYYTYYTGKSKSFIAYPRGEVFKHMLPPPPTNPKTPNQTRKNVALNTPRQLKNNDKSWTQCFISSHINDQGLSSGGNGAGVNYPLYQFKHPNYTENFTPEFRSFIDKHYNHSFEPLEVLGYIYALLYSPNYRKRYEDFLKNDYPKILFTNNKDLFRALSLLGIELIGLHVLNQESLNYSFGKLKDATIGESCYKEEHNPIIKKPSHNEPDQRLYINHSAYFRGVSQEIYDYRIGGYGVLDKYLKSHKNEPCDFDHVTNIIKVIARTIEIQKTLGFLTSDLPHLKGNDSKALMQEILQNPPPPPHLIPISPLSYRAKPKPSETLTLMAHSSAKKRAITTSIAEVGDQPSLYSVLPNLALICDRGSKVSPISNVFVTNMLCDLHVNGSGSYAFLLYRLK